MRKPGYQFKKAGPGRPKGLQNKTTVAVKEAFQEAFNGIGGIPAFIAWAQDEKNQGEFYKLFAKLLPLQVSGDKENPLEIVHKYAVPETRAIEP